jgi:hypothetical protein
LIQEEEIIQILRHDLHKIRITGSLAHKNALQDTVAQQSDGMAAWMSRNFLKVRFEESLYRKSLIFQNLNLKTPRTLVSLHRLEAADLFKESSAVKMHAAILRSQLLNLYCEAREFPYSSLKYHILLACALFYNFKCGYNLKDLYLCENLLPESPFQIVYQDFEREWTILPNQSKEGLSKIYPRFYITWERRRKESFGGEHQIFDETLSSIGSWTVALATIEDFFALIQK